MSVSTAALTTSEHAPRGASAGALSPAQWGMIVFLGSEASFFSTLIVAYLTFMGKDSVGPTPREALSLPLVIGTTICLLASSATIHVAGKRFGAPGFARWWALTIALGIAFLAGTAYEWRELVEKQHLTINRNLFGTTYFTLVGFHGLHVTLGVVAMSIVLALAARHRLESPQPVELVSWYWHFVDGVWIAVFSMVYLVSRYWT